MKNKFVSILHVLFFLVIFQNCTSKKIQPINDNETSISTHYDRKLYNHWIDKDNNCIDTRNEILKSRSLIPVEMNKKGCKVKSGKWMDYYFDETLTRAKDIDIDHLVPLHNAHISGADQWTPQMKEDFANDEENLVITNKHYNRQKGSKTIAEWLPVDKIYACKYVIDWVKIKKKYQLMMSKSELESIEQIKKNCKGL